MTELDRICRSFGKEAARAKVSSLRRIAEAPRLTRRDLESLAGSIEFVRAYPDDPDVLEAVRRAAARLPEREVILDFSYGVVQALVAGGPPSLEIAWESLEDDGPLLEILDLLVLPGESDGVVDGRVPLSDWFERTRREGVSDLAHLLGLLQRSGLPAAIRTHLFESCGLPILYRGPRISDLGLPVRRVRYQRAPIPRDTFPLVPFIRKPPGRAVRGGAGIVRLALQTLCAREIEIYPLIHATPGDVTLINGGRGVRTALIGVEPAWRSPLESLFFFMIFKNGVPVAYGPAAVLGGCCEMGINLFPEFRGGEIRYLYGEFMRVMHHRLGVDYFFLTRYGMGENNELAIRTGAFWFYRKLGFRPTNPRVEALARAEEAYTASNPGHRSDRRTLRKLSRTEAFLDLSGGRHRPLDLGRLSLAESRFLSGAGDRRRAAARCSARLGRILGVDPGARAVRALAPALCLLEDLPGWTRSDMRLLAEFLRAKDAPSETRAARLSTRHSRLLEGLRRIASG